MLPPFVRTARRYDGAGLGPSLWSGARRAWTPARLPGLVGWWSAVRSPITLNGSKVAQIDDLSSSGAHIAQATDAARPTLTSAAINGRPALDFDGADDSLAVATAAHKDLWDGGAMLASVLRADSAGGGGLGRIMDKDRWVVLASDLLSGAVRVRFLYKFSGATADWQTATRPITIGQPCLVEVEYDASNAANDPVIRVNGAAAAVTRSVAPSGTRLSDDGLGLFVGNAQSGVRGWDGAQGEHVLLSAVPGAADKAALRGYLAGAWGLTL